MVPGKPGFPGTILCVMNLGLGTKLIGWLFMIVIGVGFLIESAPVFLIAAALMVGWIGYILRPSRA